jgi:hypothetical protein
MPMYHLNNLKMPLEVSEAEAVSRIASQYAVAPEDICLIKKSLDARNKQHLYFIYAAEINTAKELSVTPDLQPFTPHPPLDFTASKTSFHRRPIIVGSGPSGMMAAICLAEAGAKPLIIERGAPVHERQKDVQNFWKTGQLKTESNVQFGEGGAGTFSDGKLMTGIKKDAFTAKVIAEFITAGAPKEIAYLAKPHIGTDNLVSLAENIRHKVESLGGEYLFYHTLQDIVVEDGKLVAAVVTDKEGKTEKIATDTLILALGHSARDTFSMLYERGLNITQKPFAVGVRIEHCQSDINLAQYGKVFATSPYVGAADYKLAVHLPNNRSVYTFCMCPGGVVVGATNLQGHVVTNGMSEFKRDKQNANAALLVNVDERDFGSAHPLAGMYFQEELEKKAFELGGKNYFAPVQLVGDFLQSKASTHLAKVKPSYLPGVTPADFRKLFSQELYQALQEGIKVMNNKLKGFSSPDAVLTAVESRSSSPVRLVRDENNMSNIAGIYPIGEGAGYAGGITSAAADGVKTVYKLLQR